MKWGKLYGIGVGPGDPDLLTIKAKNTLEKLEVLFVPKSTYEKRSLAYSIVCRALDKQWRTIDLLLPMTQDRATLEGYWHKGALKIIEHLYTGQDGAFITLGDPTLYSTFTYLLKQVKTQAPEVPVEIIPGISAVNAISATLQQALAEGDEKLLITPAWLGEEDLACLLKQFDNIVLMKAGRQIEQISKVLDEDGLKRQAYLCSRYGFADVIRTDDLREIKGQELDYLSTVIIKNKVGGQNE